MSNAPQSAQIACNHERRPGTTVCLLCRHAERRAAGERRKKLLLRGSALAIVVTVAGVTVWMGASVLRGRWGSGKNDAAEPAQIVASVTSTPAATDTNQAATVAANTPAPVTQDAGTVPPPPIAQQGLSPRPPLVPVIAAGESTLGDNVTAVRSDSVVMVSFDAPMLRTRRPEKFEQFLRTTLRQVYGAAIDSSLAKIPEGGLVGQGNLVYDLPTRGIHIPLSAAWKLDVFPEIRPGQDGPLVIRYRASLSPTP